MHKTRVKEVFEVIKADEWKPNFNLNVQVSKVEIKPDFFYQNSNLDYEISVRIHNQIQNLSIKDKIMG